MQLDARAKSMLDQLQDLKKKQEESRKMVKELERSIFNKLGDELTTHNIGSHANLRFYLFARFLEMVLGTDTIAAVDVARYSELMKIMSAKSLADPLVPNVVEWLDYWVDAGELTRASFRPKDIRYSKYSLRKEAP